VIGGADRSHRRTVRRLGGAAALGLALLAVAPAIVLAHPLGNFTINHYAGLRVAPDAIEVDAVLDQAEIPTFDARRDIDTDGDGEVSDAEADSARAPECRSLAASLVLSVGGSRLPLELVAAGLEFPIGAAGLPTMRLVCELHAALPAGIDSNTAVSFTDGSFSERIGWREMTVVGNGVTVEGANVRSASASNRLTSYPTDLLQQPLADRSVSFTAARGGAPAPVFAAPDAHSLDEAARAAGPDAPPGGDAARNVDPATVSVVPGGIGGEIDGLLRTRDLTPIVLIASMLAAAALGAGHALTPGHGKTLMGAYLVGARGTPVHALGLGLSVAVSHTLGILVLALVVLAAGTALPPDQFQRLAPVVSAVTLTAVGAWLLVGQVRRRTFAVAAAPHGHDQPHGHDDRHGHDHPHGHDGPHGHEAEHVASAADARLSWRNLFVLGLAGGLVPSTNALLILLATIATNRPAFGLVLVGAFGLGMAGVMAGVGLALIYGRDWLASRPRLPAAAKLTRWAPAAAAVFVLALGVVLTTEALGAARL
jgi:nickel/cobalt transporter (NicO) family protein